MGLWVYIPVGPVGLWVGLLDPMNGIHVDLCVYECVYASRCLSVCASY
jgi:hypothetical protein